MWPSDLNRHVKHIHNDNSKDSYIYQQYKQHHEHDHKQKLPKIITCFKQQQQQQQKNNSRDSSYIEQQQKVPKMMPNQQNWSFEDNANTRKEEVEQQQQQQQGFHTSARINQQEHFKLLHTFTGMIAGPTACGKTYLVKEILQRELIEPFPERIIWLYKRWQPLYDVISSTVHPKPEFLQDIPIDLDKDSFINPRVRNLIIIDDLMSSLVKDPRVNDLFTEGSHHRNLSVIVLSQNLYFSKDPTQRRNCHYLILFNNPVDKQQIMTLARQMYPGKCKIFMDKFENATAIERGYLLVDLKPTTPEALRLKGNIFHKNCINPKIDSMHKVCSDNISETAAKSVQTELDDIKKSHLDNLHFENSYLEEQDCNMLPCDDCGLVFNDEHDLQRHVKKWCPENPRREIIKTKEQPNKKIKLSENTNNDENIDLELEAFNNLIKISKSNIEDEKEEKVKKFRDRGLSEKDAELKASKKVKADELTEFVDLYVQILDYFFQLQNGRIHNIFIKKILQMIKNGYDVDKAVRLSVSKYKYHLEDLLNEYDKQTGNESDTEETDEDDEITENESTNNEETDAEKSVDEDTDEN